MLRPFQIHNSILLLLQGILLLGLCISVFVTPQENLDSMLMICALGAVGTGLLFLLKYFFGEDKGVLFPDLFNAVAILVIAVILFNQDHVSREWLVVWVACLLMLITLSVFNAAMEISYAFRFWWITLFSLVIAGAICYYIVSDNLVPGLSIITSALLLFLGVLMIWLSILDRRVEKEFHKTIRELRD